MADGIDIAIAYEPPGPVLKAFMRSNAFVRGIRGPMGSGKSTGCCIEIGRRACEQAPGSDGIRHTRWAVIRNTYSELKTTTQKTWHAWWPQRLGKWQAEGPPTHTLRFGDIDAEVLFLALDRPEDIAKLLSLELTGAWINEAREVPKAILDALTARVGRYPAAKDGGCTWSGILLDTNPPDTDHWWYRLAEEDRPDGFDFFAQPDGLSEAAENLDWLNQSPDTLSLSLGHPDRRAAGRKYYERLMAGKDVAWVKVYVRGDYGFVQDGKPVYPEYVDQVHCRPVTVNPSLPIYIGLDFGLTPAAVLGQRAANGQWRWFGEIVTEDMGTKRFGEILGAELRGRYPDHLFRIYGDPAGDSRAQTDETTPFDILISMGIEAEPAPSNDPLLRREAVASALSRMIDGEPGLIVSPECRTLRKGMAGAYRYRRLQVTGTETYRDVPEKNKFSHVCDAAQYLMLGAGEGDTLIKAHHRDDEYGEPETVADYDPYSWGPAFHS